MNDLSQKFLMREMRYGDRAYICRTILFSQIELDSYTRKINKDSFLTGHNKLINRMLDHAKCLVLVDPQEQGLIYAFIVFDHMGDFDIIHFAYVRKDFRGLGLLKNLVSIVKTKPNVAISHINENIKPAKLKSYWTKAIFDPFLL